MKRLLFVIFGLFLMSINALAQDKARILIGPNVLVSWEGGGNADELQVAANPTNPRNLFGTGILFRANHPQRVQENRGYYSLDGGYSWNTARFPDQTSEDHGDPQAAFGRTGTAYFVSMMASPRDGTILFYRSEDGGISWSKPVEIGSQYDHEQIAVDHTPGRFAGHVYVAMLKYYRTLGDSHSHRIHLFRSVDDGRSWIGPVEVAKSRHTENRGLQVFNPLVFAGGELFIPIVDFPFFPLGEPKTIDRKCHAWFATSNDGGATFTAPKKLAINGGGEVTVRTGVDSPVYAIDNSDGLYRDRIYVAWPPFADEPPSGKWRLMLSYSDNRGKTWSRPELIDAGSTVADQFRPTLAVNKEGTLAVTWFDRVGPSMISRYMTASVDGGKSFLPPVRLSSFPAGPSPGQAFGKWVGATVSLLNQDGTTIKFLGGRGSHGEYYGLTADSEGIFHPFWTDDRTGSNQIWTARVRVARDRGDPTQAINSTELIEADVTDRVEAVLEPFREFPFPGAVDLPIRLKNKSNQPIYRPFKVEVDSLTPDGAIPILNSTNGKAGVGATIDYSRALGDFESLPPGAISEGVVWRFKAPSNIKEFREFRGFRLKVTARIKRPKEATPLKPASAKL